MGEVRWRILLLALAATALFITLAEPGTATLCSQCSQYDLECQTTCTPDPYCTDGTCNGEETCGTCPYDCGTAVCSSGQTRLTSSSCGANATWTQICTSNLCGWTNYQCTCIQSSTFKCDAATYKTCTSGQWGACVFDCRNLDAVCNSAPLCKYKDENTCTPTGCVYANRGPGYDCGSSTYVCNGQGSCSMPRCTIGRCAASLSNAYLNTSAWCDGGLKCYQCNPGYVYDSASGTCITSTCSPNISPFCEGNTLNTCTIQSNGLYAWKTEACTVCTVTPAPAHCCTPTTTACSSYTCGSTTNNCGQTINCGTNNGGCPTGQTCSSTTGPGTCITTCVPSACTNTTNPCSTIGWNGCSTCTRTTENNACTTGVSDGLCKSQSCKPLCTLHQSQFCTTTTPTGNPIFNTATNVPRKGTACGIRNTHNCGRE